MTKMDSLIKRVLGSLVLALFALAAAGCVGPPVVIDDGPVIIEVDEDLNDPILEEDNDGEVLEQEPN